MSIFKAEESSGKVGPVLAYTLLIRIQSGDAITRLGASFSALFSPRADHPESADDGNDMNVIGPNIWLRWRLGPMTRSPL
ncbi:hypothetical protein ASPCADRAFT_679 [Aspergillus carbonarius ITEM 5010]|uniref:Uncharacterized protein n=1 Tax=Aspergillus carbonarius (strain ITEM 5010) TaxID=602072 RepID=A0A1R3S2I4_ASPC5|nr:hypothetical protein ASPCADRAFT_679 [Aspergillus carbonarius ITEM 5010]